jgi:hypothetical protein
MTVTDVSGVMLWGAHCREWGKKLADNPYAASPGTYVLHNAWKYGFQHAAEVMARWLGDDPNDEAFDHLREPVVPRERDGHLITFQGRTMNLTQWAAEIGLTMEGLRGRLKHMSVEEALTTPTR